MLHGLVIDLELKVVSIGGTAARSATSKGCAKAPKDQTQARQLSTKLKRYLPRMSPLQFGVGMPLSTYAKGDPRHNATIRLMMRTPRFSYVVHKPAHFGPPTWWRPAGGGRHRRPTPRLTSWIRKRRLLLGFRDTSGRLFGCEPVERLLGRRAGALHPHHLGIRPPQSRPGPVWPQRPTRRRPAIADFLRADRITRRPPGKTSGVPAVSATTPRSGSPVVAS